MSNKCALIFVFFLLAAAAPQKEYHVAAPVRFTALDIYIDSGAAPLAAYQLTFSAPAGEMQVVGVENGDHPAFATAPYFDREAVRNGKADRIIVAAFNTGSAEKLPRGRTRVTTIHLQVRGNEEIEYKVVLNTAATVGEKKINAQISYAKGTGK